MKNKNKLMHYINIFLVLLCMLTIFLFSCENAEKSNKRTDKIINNVINVSSSDNNIIIDHNIETGENIIITVVRKGAHFLEFFLLGFLVANLIKDYKELTFKRIIFCILFCLLYSISDEIHQLFVDGRSCEFRDIVIDTSGSTIGALLYYFLYVNFHKSKVIKSLKTE